MTDIQIKKVENLIERKRQKDKNIMREEKTERKKEFVRIEKN